MKKAGVISEDMTSKNRKTGKLESFEEAQEWMLSNLVCLTSNPGYRRSNTPVEALIEEQIPMIR